jgi:predicted GIY-YIG superfamily endonuclease
LAKNPEQYEDIKGFCKSAQREEVEKHGYVLTPGRYVGIKDAEDDLPAPKPNTFYVYVIKCSNDTLYIGQTQDLRKRWKEHILGKASDWTKKYPPKFIIHHEIFSTREEAVNREKELKTTNGRRYLKKIIEDGSARQAGGIPFEEKMHKLTTTLAEQFAKEEKMNAEIKKQLAKIGFSI